MNWFKKKNKPEICGYLDVNGNFYKDKNLRDEVNKKIDYQFKLNKIIYSFDEILDSMYEKRRSFMRVEDILDLPNNQKIKLMDTYIKYLKLEENNKL